MRPRKEGAMAIPGAAPRALEAAKQTSRKRGAGAKIRRCKNCDAAFSKNCEWQEFCAESCKKEFWRAGGVSIRRLTPIIAEMVSQAMKPHVEELRQLRA